MNDFSQLQAGDLMFTTIRGIGGKLIALGEKLNDKSVTWEIAKKVQHVGMVSTDDSGVCHPKIVEAMPGGAIEVTPDAAYLGPEFIWIRPAYRWHQGQNAGVAAWEYIHTPYSWLDYAAITAHHLHIPAPHLDDYIKTSKHMICSQLVDQALKDAGFHVFTDKRLSQDVTPAALYVGVLARAGTVIL
jgi:hypothetical protein